jgi:hypothetical protein
MVEFGWGLIVGLPIMDWVPLVGLLELLLELDFLL